MTSNFSPRDLLIAAWRLGHQTLPEYSSFYSCKDFTLPQLFACLALRHFFDLSYRRTAALLADTPDWLAAIELESPPHHKTINDAFDTITNMKRPGIQPLEAMFMRLACDFERSGLLRLDELPLTIDSTYFETHHVSRHYEKRKQKMDAKSPKNQKPDAQGSITRSATVRKLPKLVMAVAAGCHLILSCATATGMSGDQNCLHDVLVDAWTRAPVRTLVADAGFDTEANHELARLDLGLERCLIPPNSGRPTDNAPTTPFRAEAAIAFKLATQWHRQTYGQRAQSETANSMLKRNFGPALRARTPERREREMALRAIVHNLALIPRGGLP